MAGVKRSLIRFGLFGSFRGGGVTDGMCDCVCVLSVGGECGIKNCVTAQFRNFFFECVYKSNI